MFQPDPLEDVFHIKRILEGRPRRKYLRDWQLCELSRLHTVSTRDGVPEAKEWALRTRKVYIHAARSRRLRQGRTDRFREEYLMSAFSLRYLLRNAL
jgi:hypothetical protein